MSVNQQNLASIRHNFANTAFGHKVHEMAAERKDKRSTAYKCGNLIIIGIVVILLVVQTFVQTNLVFTYISAGLTVAEIVFFITGLSFNHESEVASHKNTALKYMNLRDRYRSLIADIVGGRINDVKAGQKRDELLHEYQVISDLALATTKTDYNRAMDELQLTPDGQNTWSDEQINSLLPEALRTTSL